MKKIFILILFFSIQIFAQDIKITKPKEVNLAHLFDITFSFDNLKDEKVLISTKNFNNSDFEIYKISKNKNDFIFQIMPFNIGISTFPPIDFEINNKILSTKPFNLTIKGNLKEKDNKISDIYPPLFFLKPLWIILLLILLLILFFLIKHFLKKKKDFLSPLIAEEKFKTPYEKALFNISELKLNIKAISPYIFYDKLSEIFRIYLKEEYLINADKMTTYDTMKNLKDKINNIDFQIKVRELLDISDLAKFAKFMPDELKREKDLEEASFIITELEKISSEKKELLRQEELKKNNNN